MRKKIKIISDGKNAKLFINGKKVLCKDLKFQFVGNADCKPMIKFYAKWLKQDKERKFVLNCDKTEILTDELKLETMESQGFVCKNCKYAKKMDDENKLECIREKSVETIRIVVDENDSCRLFDGK